MITQSLSEFIVKTDANDIPDATRQMLRLSMLDWAACGIAGAPEPVAEITRGMALSEEGIDEAHVFGCAQSLPARVAALVNGTTSHALDYDDTHFAHIGHPSVAVFPAALAVAEQRHLTVADLQMAALIGIETSIRVGVWLGRDHYQTGFHQTGTAGAFGAAAAVAKLLGFDAQKTAMTLGLVATRASGLKSQFGTMGKPYNAGLAASNGVEAALLVERGFVSNPLGLEAAQGFGATHAGQNRVRGLEGLGQTWLFDDISHKFHACCHGLHATLEALAGMNRPAARDVEKVEIQTHPRWITVCNQLNPETGLGAKFSYRMVTAMALLGHPTSALESYSDALCKEPEIVALRGKVQVCANADLSETEARVKITLLDGSILAASHDLNAPMTLEDREARLKTKASALIGGYRTKDLWALIISDVSAQSLGHAIAS
ncbi:2-methylcitrate dehydratase PrpD [Shimia gijangensis]|uniref:2-methylcitrate dehydratase PrpD n=1 Tax=Shimia gijangensis TaxID=1470563 RepID=A0A1M6HQ47_9RHOB|nr:MmgE/PrpD family protein [Shimia gijangensis]SHJ24307.1 2-methylcitrate dehydratase PrpD [Shimia gijangensis]